MRKDLILHCKRLAQVQTKIPLRSCLSHCLNIFYRVEQEIKVMTFSLCFDPGLKMSTYSFVVMFSLSLKSTYEYDMVQQLDKNRKSCIFEHISSPITKMWGVFDMSYSFLQ